MNQTRRLTIIAQAYTDSDWNVVKYGILQFTEEDLSRLLNLYDKAVQDKDWDYLAVRGLYPVFVNDNLESVALPYMIDLEKDFICHLSSMEIDSLEKTSIWYSGGHVEFAPNSTGIQFVGYIDAGEETWCHVDISTLKDYYKILKSNPKHNEHATSTAKSQ